MDDGSLQGLKDHLTKAQELLFHDDRLASLADLDHAKQHLQAAVETLEEWLSPPNPYVSTTLRPGLQRIGDNDG